MTTPRAGETREAWAECVRAAETACAAGGGFALETTPWPAPGFGYVCLTIACRRGHEVRGILPRGTRRAETRALVDHLRGRHAREHACGCASTGAGG